MNALERKAAETANNELNVALETLSDIQSQLARLESDGAAQLKDRARLLYRQMAKVNAWLNAMSEVVR